jgi:hypothetical protein
MKITGKDPVAAHMHRVSAHVKKELYKSQIFHEIDKNEM